MATLWVISGAGRGVGKTHLAERLCQVLPASLHAKCGHGPRQPHKSPHLLRSPEELEAFLEAQAPKHEHLLIESNALARQGRADIIIYLAGAPVGSEIRADADRLRAKAHVVVDPEVSPALWRDYLANWLRDDALLDAVLAILSDQARYLARQQLAVRSKVWFEAEQGHVFGPGLFRLLEGIGRYGTLHDSARAAGMSYRYAWNQLRNAERRLGEKLILRQPGGAGGGRSRLTDRGRHLLSVFERVNREVAAFADERFAHYYAEGKDDA